MRNNASQIGEQIRTLVIGGGQCGAQIAAELRRYPSFIQVPRPENYPVVGAVFDTDGSIVNILFREWHWPEELRELIFPVTPPNNTEVWELLYGRGSSKEKKTWELEISGSGIGGRPLLGREAARRFFENHESIQWQQVRDRLTRQSLGVQGVLVVNSLTGGTGSGFAPFIHRFAARDIGAPIRLALNLCVIPEPIRMASPYPRSILCSLHFLLKEGICNGIVLLDNQAMKDHFRCLNLQQINAAVREILAPLLLSPTGRYNVPKFEPTLDFADMQSWIQGQASPDFCVLAYHQLILSRGWWGRPVPQPEQLLMDLVDGALEHTTAGISTSATPSAVVGVLSASPDFYTDFLHNDSGYIGVLFQQLVKKHRIKRAKLGTLRFEGMLDVRLTLLLSGVRPTRVAQVCATALGPTYIDFYGHQSLADYIRELDSEFVTEKYMEEARSVFGLRK